MRVLKCFAISILAVVSDESLPFCQCLNWLAAIHEN